MKKIAIGDKRFVITKNLIMMLVMLVVIFIAIFAWYSNNDTVTASGTQISAKSADNVELALPVKSGNSYVFPTSNSSWSTEIDFKESEFFKDLVKDITSDGEQFVIPNFKTGSIESGRVVIADDVWEPGLSSKEALTNSSALDDDQYNYISFDFYIRAKQKKISVTGESFLAAGSEKGIKDDGTIGEEKPLVGNDIYRKSTYGGNKPEQSFSSDAIVGAMRVSLVGAPVSAVGVTSNQVTETISGNQNLDFLWLPRPDVHLNTTSTQNGWTLTTGVHPTNNPNNDSTYMHSFFFGKTVSNTVKKGLEARKYWDPVNYPQETSKPSDVTDSTVFRVSKTLNDNDLGAKGHYPTLGKSAEIANDAPESSKGIKFTAGTEPGDNRETTGYYVYKYTLNIWIEGEDAEARRSMNKGVFNLELDFGS